MSKSKFTVKQHGKPDYMGFAWFALYLDGKAFKQSATPVKVKAKDEAHALAILKQLNYQVS